MRREESLYLVDLDGGSVVLGALRLELQSGTVTGTVLWQEGDDPRRTQNAIPFAAVNDLRPFAGSAEEAQELNAAFAERAERWQRSDFSPPQLIPGRHYHARLESGQLYSGKLLQTMTGPNGQRLVMFELADGARMALNRDKIELSQ